MITTFAIEYEIDEPDERLRVERMMQADEAWCALSKIEDIIRAHRKSDDTGDLEGDKVTNLLYQITEEINETRLDKVWA